MNGSSPGEPMSSHVMVGGTPRSASQPAVASANATMTAGPSSQTGAAFGSSQRRRRCTRSSSLFPLRPRGSRRVSRADCIRLAVVGLLLVGVVSVFSAGGQSAASPLAPINGLREDDELAPVGASAELDSVAARYLNSMIDMRCLCPVPDGQAGAERLLADVRSAIGSDASVLDAGLVVGYDQSQEAAIRTVVLDPANGAMILGARVTLVGFATRAVEVEDSWLAPPPGGVGPEIELGGYTLVVIVMAGRGE